MQTTPQFRQMLGAIEPTGVDVINDSQQPTEFGSVVGHTARCRVLAAAPSGPEVFMRLRAGDLFTC